MFGTILFELNFTVGISNLYCCYMVSDVSTLRPKGRSRKRLMLYIRKLEEAFLWFIKKEGDINVWNETECNAADASGARAYRKKEPVLCIHLVRRQYHREQKAPDDLERWIEHPLQQRLC